MKNTEGFKFLQKLALRLFWTWEVFPAARHFKKKMYWLKVSVIKLLTWGVWNTELLLLWRAKRIWDMRLSVFCRCLRDAERQKETVASVPPDLRRSLEPGSTETNEAEIHTENNKATKKKQATESFWLPAQQKSKKQKMVSSSPMNSWLLSCRWKCPSAGASCVATGSSSSRSDASLTFRSARTRCHRLSSSGTLDSTRTSSGPLPTSKEKTTWVEADGENRRRWERKRSQKKIQINLCIPTICFIRQKKKKKKPEETDAFHCVKHIFKFHQHIRLTIQCFHYTATTEDSFLPLQNQISIKEINPGLPISQNQFSSWINQYKIYKGTVVS